MVAPRLIGQALKGEPITVYGTGDQSRCFCSVSDVVTAIIHLMNHPDCVGQIFNIGSTEEITIADLAKKVKKITGSKSEIVKIPYDEAYEFGFEDMARRVPDTRKIQEFIGWKPTMNLADTLKAIVDYLTEKQVPYSNREKKMAIGV